MLNSCPTEWHLLLTPLITSVFWLKWGKVPLVYFSNMSITPTWRCHLHTENQHDWATKAKHLLLPPHWFVLLYGTEHLIRRFPGWQSLFCNSFTGRAYQLDKRLWCFWKQWNFSRSWAQCSRTPLLTLLVLGGVQARSCPYLPCVSHR